MEYYNKHMGHQCQQIHLNVPQQVKESVASLLNNKVDGNHIIRNSESTFDLKLSKQDIQNIKNKFGINLDSKLHSNDSISVDILVQQLKDQGHYILGYKKIN